MSVKLKKTPPPSTVLNGQYQDGQITNQNQKKNTCHFYNVFQVLEVLFIKICKIQPLDLLFIVVFNSFCISKQISFSQLHSGLSAKKIFCHEFSLFNRFMQTPTPLNSQNLLSMTNFFCQCSINRSRGPLLDVYTVRYLLF